MEWREDEMREQVEGKVGCPTVEQLGHGGSFNSADP